MDNSILLHCPRPCNLREELHSYRDHYPP